MKYIAYYRVSTKKQGKSGLGLESQKAIVRHYIDKNDIVQEFTEVASAKYMTCRYRPLLCQAIDYCIENGYTLVVANVDRLSRETQHALSIFDSLEGRLVSCDVPNLDKFTLTIFMAIATRENELKSIRTKRGLAEKKKQGFILGKPQNFTNEGRMKGALENKKNADSHIRNIQAKDKAKDLKEKGLTLTAIAEKLNKLEYKTRRGKSFRPTTIKRLLAS